MTFEPLSGDRNLLFSSIITLLPSANSLAAYDPQLGCPQLHRRVMNFRASSHWVEQYLLPGCAIQLQPSFAHFWGVFAIAGPLRRACRAYSDAALFARDVCEDRTSSQTSSLSAHLQKVFGMLQARLCQLLTAQHPGDLPRSFNVIHLPDLRLSPSALLSLLNEKVLVRKRGNLR